MQLLNRYKKTIEALSKGHRFQEIVSDELSLELHQQLSIDAKYLNEALCVLQNTSSFLPQLEPHLLSLLKQASDSDLVIHALNASRKHIIEAKQRDGQRLDFEFLDLLKKLLQHKNWEVKEWVVRTIDECGSQALFFKEDLKSIYPSKMGMITNQHKRHIRGIIDLMTISGRGI